MDPRFRWLPVTACVLGALAPLAVSAVASVFILDPGFWPVHAGGLALAALIGLVLSFSGLHARRPAADQPEPARPAPAEAAVPQDWALRAARLGQDALALDKGLEQARDANLDLHSGLAAADALGAQAAQQAAQALQGLEQARTIVAQAREALDALNAAVERVVTGAANASAKLSVIADASEQAQALVGNMAAMADQTNLLSLNASIEAEKAGAHGRGFGVVAKEIRQLADTAAQAAQDIERLVGRTRQAVAAEVMEMDTFARQAASGAQHAAQAAREAQTAHQGLEDAAARLNSLSGTARGLPGGLKAATQAAGRLQDALDRIAAQAESLRAGADALALGAREHSQTKDAPR